MDLKLAYRVDNSTSWLKLRQYFVAPAIALPNIHVTVVIERLDGPNMAPPPMVPRPPITDPSAPPTSPTPVTPPGPVPVVPRFYVDSGERGLTAPAWRVAAQGLARTTYNLQRGLSPQIDAYGAWLMAPNSAVAAPFRARIEKVLSAAGVTGGDHNTYVSLSLALAPGE